MKILMAFFITLIGIVAYYALTKPLAVRVALPMRSLISMDEVYESSPNGDYLHCIRAKASEAEFDQFTDELMLHEVKNLVGSRHHCDAEWWDKNFYAENVSGRDDNTSESSSYASYRNGFVFYISWSS